MGDDTAPETLCPSAPAHSQGAVLIGVATVMAGRLQIANTAQPVSASQELFDAASPYAPEQLFRFANRCGADACKHFDGSSCQLAAGAVRHLEETSSRIPPCSIRVRCRWFQQEGPSICLRCPQIITQQASPTETMERIVDHS